MRALGSFLLALVGAAALVGGGFASLAMAFAPPFWMRLAAHFTQSELLLQPPLWLALTVLATGVAAVVAASHGPLAPSKLSASVLHGSARFATTAEVRALGHRSHGIVLCMESEAELAPDYAREGQRGWKVTKPRPFIAIRSMHVLAEGPTGAGKGENLVLPSLLSDVFRSYVVLDPENELYEQSAGYRSIYNHIQRFAPSEEGSARFNPLLVVPLGTLREATVAERIANVLCSAAKDERDSSYFYSESAQPLLAAAILYALHNLKGRDRSLPGVSRLIGGVGEQKDIVDRVCTGLPEYAVELRGMLQRLKDDKKTLISAFTTCLNALKFCRLPTVADAISGSDFETQDLFSHAAPTTVYLVFPFGDATVLRPLARLMLDVMLSQHRVARKHDSVYLLDEVPILGNIPALSRGIAEIRKFGVQLVLPVQSEAQLFAAYGKEGAENIIDNCRVRLSIGVSSQRSTEAASERMGKTTIVRPRKTQAVSRRSLLETTITNTTGEGEQARELMTSDEVRAMPSSEILVDMPELRTYRGKRAVRYGMPELMRRSQLPPPQSVSVKRERWLREALDIPRGTA